MPPRHSSVRLTWQWRRPKLDNDHIETRQEFTTDKATLNDALDSIYIEGGQTSLIDATYLSAQHVAQYKASGGDAANYRRRALILMTDGDERISYYTQDKLVNLLRQLDVQVFAICLVKDSKKTVKLNQNPQKRAADLLNKLASETGGRAFFPKSVSELHDIANQITSALRQEYVVGYQPSAKEKPGAVYRSVMVNVLDVPAGEKRIATARAGYAIPDK